MMSLKRTAQSLVRWSRATASRGRVHTHGAEALREIVHSTVPWDGRAAFNLSIDFELCWGNGRLDGQDISLEQRLAWSRRVTENFQGFMDLLREYRFPATWAVLARIAEPRRVPGARFSPPWARRDWYANDDETRTDLALWDGRKYLDAVRDARPEHEVMSHGFGHIDYGDASCTAEIAREDMVSSRQILESMGFRVSGFVYPCNSVGHVELLPDAGYTIARGSDPRWHLDTPVPMTPRGFWISPGMMSWREFRAVLREGVRRRAFVHPWFHLHEPDVRHRDLAGFMRPMIETVLEHRIAGELDVVSFADVERRLAGMRNGVRRAGSYA